MVHVDDMFPPDAGVVHGGWPVPPDSGVVLVDGKSPQM